MFCLPLYIVQQEEFLLQEEEQHPPQPQLRWSQRTRALVVHYGINKYADTAHYINSARVEETTNFGEALKSKFSKQWRDVADTEYAS